MGVIRRQSLRTAILSYLGVGLGYINVVLLFPVFFEPEQFGLTRVLIAVIGISAQFALFGMTNAIIRFFPRFKGGDEDKHHGMLGLALLSGFIGTAIVAAVLLIVQPWVIGHYQERSALFVQFYYLLFPYLLFEVCYQIFTSYTRALYHAVINVLFREVFLRAGTFLLILSYHFNLIGFDDFMLLFIAQFGIMAAGLAIYLLYIGKFSLKIDSGFLTPSLKKELVRYGSFTMLSSVGALFLMNIDVIMISSMIGLDQTAFYAVAFYIVALMNIPRNALNNISVPVISDAWKRNDRETIQRIYVKTSINQFLLGMLLFIGIWANEANIFSMLPQQYSGGKWVLLFVGLARLADIGFGVNGGIITTSEYYRFDTYANLILIGLTVALNLLFIPAYGITGAAMATGISLLSFNIGKYVFLKLKFGFDPFTWRSAVTVVLGAVAYSVSCLLPQQSDSVVDLVLRAAVIVAIYVPISLALKLSVDVNDLVVAIWKSVKK